MPTPNPSTRREYKGAAAATTLQNSISNTDISFVLVAANNWPTGSVGKFVITINRGQADEEKILCDSQTSRTVACLLANRGFDGTTAQGHAAGATVECTISAFDADEWNQHTNATSGVHGAAGTVVGTTDAQTLTNKTLTAPVVGGGVAGGNWKVTAAGYVQGTALYVQVKQQTTSTGFGSGATTAVSWDAITLGSSTMWGAGNPTRLVAPIAGVYGVVANLNFTQPAGATTYSVVYRVNGTTYYNEQFGYVPGLPGANASGSSGLVVIPLAANDYVEIMVHPTSQALATNQGAIYFPNATMFLIGQ